MTTPRRGNDLYRSTQWRTLRKQLLTTNPDCAYCGQPATTLDHLIPISKGGPPLDPTNLIPACNPCNASRGNRPAPGLRNRTPTVTTPVFESSETGSLGATTSAASGGYSEKSSGLEQPAVVRDGVWSFGGGDGG
jgi:5-methylcytosine-specific restriction endonuclease McrA